MAKPIKHFIVFLLILSSQKVFSDTIISKPGFIHIKQKFEKLLIREKWLFKNGDDLTYAKKEFNDEKWDTLHSSLIQDEISKSGFKGKAWFRMHLTFDSTFENKTYVFSIFQYGASEIYLNGKLIKRIGDYGSKLHERDNGENAPIYFVPAKGEDNIIAIRYENLEYGHCYNSSGELMGGFYSTIWSPEKYFENALSGLIGSSFFGMGIFSFIFSIGLVHFLLFIFYRLRRSNLLFSIFCFLFSYYFLHLFLVNFVITDPNITGILNAIVVITVPFFFVSLLTVLYSLFYVKTPKQAKYFRIVAGLSSFLLIFAHTPGYIIGLFLVLAVIIELVRVLIIAIRQKKKGAVLISVGFGMFALFIAFIFVIFILSSGVGKSYEVSGNSIGAEIFYILFFGAIASIPISMSVFLAWDFGQTNKTLSKKLIEVEELSIRSIEQEKEKQKILFEQNENLEIQVIERTKEINEQKKLIEEKNKDITDSINYAQRIQRSILPTEKEIKDIFTNSFVLFKPRDIVSGDFYQFKKVGDYRYAILADCTGHGVPGALMSMIGSNLLKQIIVERKILEPNKILSELHKEVKSTLRQTSGVQSHDGMDASVVLLKGNKIYISSANRPVYIVQNKELTEIKPDKRSIGGSQSSDEIEFATTELEATPDMMLYLFSDGYADQFGGEAGKKFKVKNLSGLLLSIHEKPLDIQHKTLDQTFDTWKHHLEQVDDVSLIGIRF